MSARIRQERRYKDLRTFLNSRRYFNCGYPSQMKYVSNEHGESFHLRPLPSLFHNSRQCSSSPFSYLKLFGSPVFQFMKPIGLPVDIQKNDPSSAKSVPEVQKCSKPKPKTEKIAFQYRNTVPTYQLQRFPLYP